MNILKEILSWTCTIILSIVIALAINLFLLRPSQVLGSSMEPTFHSGDIELVSKLNQTFGIEPQYNDIVIIDSRVDHKHTIKDELIDTLKYNFISSMIFKQQNHSYWIKRVIGKANDVLEFKDGKVYRNGKALDEPYIKERMFYTSDIKVVVPEKHVFVMGDNRNNSSDSRAIGCIPVQNVIGKVIFK